MCNTKKITCCFRNKIIGFCLSLYYSQSKKEKEKKIWNKIFIYLLPQLIYNKLIHIVFLPSARVLYFQFKFTAHFTTNIIPKEHYRELCPSEQATMAKRKMQAYINKQFWKVCSLGFYFFLLKCIL